MKASLRVLLAVCAAAVSLQAVPVWPGVSGLRAQESDDPNVAAESASSDGPAADGAEETGDQAASRDPFASPDVPEPNEFRTAAGAPGDAYWQQDVDYAIKVSLEGDRITGTETITYTNNSPDELTSLWLQLDQNLFRNDSYGAERAKETGAQRHAGFFGGGGVDVSAMTVEQGGETYATEFQVEDTMLEVFLPEPLAAEGGNLELTLDFTFEIPETGADRMGMLDAKKGVVYELAQWYPRVFTYDDLDGWNPTPYLGQGEWYLEYGDFEVEITVPRDMIVVATGELLNPEEVLTAQQQERLQQARGSAETVMIISRDEVGEGSSRPDGDGPLTWKYRAEDVRDFAWAASKAFVWDAAGWEDVLIMSVYPEESIGFQGFTGWERSTEYLRHSVQYYSEQWFRYPYPVAINVGGLALGMEYPMIVFCSHQARGGFLFAVTDHEIGHTWFPMIVGSDERNYAWMDEGFNTFMNYYSSMAFSGGEPILAAQMEPLQIASGMRGDYSEQPIFTVPDSVSEFALGFLAYNKPAAVLVMLREAVLKPEVFDEAFREYIRRWAYKHPQPADFFRTMEDVSGQDLGWFFEGWIYTTGLLDQAVTNVESDCREADLSTQTQEACTTNVTIQNQGDLVMPLEVRLIFSDGSEETQHWPVDIWRDNSTYIVTADRPVRHVQIDPLARLPDANRANNTYGRGLISRQRDGSR
jgi:hypothetical protein